MFNGTYFELVGEMQKLILFTIARVNVKGREDQVLYLDTVRLKQWLLPLVALVFLNV